VLDEREAPGQVSSEDVDRHGLAKFTLVDATGNERFSLTFPEGTDDPKLVYRRVTFRGGSHELPPPFIRDDQGYEIPNPACPAHLRVGRPAWLQSKWSYVLGKHYSDGRLEMWAMQADGSFVEEPNPDVELVECEQF
jgi:hypothetical protein